MKQTAFIKKDHSTFSMVPAFNVNRKFLSCANSIYKCLSTGCGRGVGEGGGEDRRSDEWSQNHSIQSMVLERDQVVVKCVRHPSPLLLVLFFLFTDWPSQISSTYWKCPLAVSTFSSTLAFQHWP